MIETARTQRLRIIAMILCLSSAAACVLAVVAGQTPFFRAYLYAYLFWLGVTLGSLCIAMIHNLTGGRWGVPIRRRAGRQPYIAADDCAVHPHHPRSARTLRLVTPRRFGGIAASARNLSQRHVFHHPRRGLFRGLDCHRLPAGLLVPPVDRTSRPARRGPRPPPQLPPGWSHLPADHHPRRRGLGHVPGHQFFLHDLWFYLRHRSGRRRDGLPPLHVLRPPGSRGPAAPAARRSRPGSARHHRPGQSASHHRRALGLHRLFPTTGDLDGQQPRRQHLVHCNAAWASPAALAMDRPETLPCFTSSVPFFLLLQRPIKRRLPLSSPPSPRWCSSCTSSSNTGSSPPPARTLARSSTRTGSTSRHRWPSAALWLFVFLSPCTNVARW